MVSTRSNARAAREKQATEAEFRILDLSPELVELAFEHLAEAPYNLLSVRCVCRAFRTHSLRSFGAEFFEHLIFVLHPDSLTILLEVASHPELSTYVRGLTVSGELIADVADKSPDTMLKDLQTSMKNSGMDRLMLIAALRKLSKLELVTIDCASFLCNAETVDGLRCGGKHIAGLLKNEGEYGDNRAFSVALSRMQDAGVAKVVKLCLNICLKYGSSQPVDYFDPTSTGWTLDHAANVHDLDLARDVTQPWVLDLLRSTPNLRRLGHGYGDQILTFSYPTGGLFSWPGLCDLHLNDSDVDNQRFTSFLELHKDTLTKLRLQLLEVDYGTWKAPLKVIASMPKLKQPYIGHLLDRYPPVGSHYILDTIYDRTEFDYMYLFLDHHLEVQSSLQAILHDLRTLSYDPGTVSRVDVRPAHAIMDGAAELENGHYKIRYPPRAWKYADTLRA